MEPQVPTRRLHLIDIQNILGERHSIATDEEVQSTVERWLTHVGHREGDHVVIACNPAIGLAAGLAIGGGQLLVRHGPDGADLALLDWAPIEHIADRFGQVVIGSGDRIFTMFARALRLRGVEVRACTREGSMSRVLRSAIESPVTCRSVEDLRPTG